MRRGNTEDAMRYLLGVLGVLASTAAADPVEDVMAAARASFDRMPSLQIVAQIAGACGADLRVNQSVAYCTSENKVFLSEAAAATPQAPYLVAHVLGHAVQVQHGIADIALREITKRRNEEAKLRGFVAAQVDCIAGFLFAKADLPAASLTDWFPNEPFTGTHWGRNPLRIGPQVSTGLRARDTWFQRGQTAADLGSCAAGEFEAALLLEAYNG